MALKVCIVTWYGSNNYGTNLQAYALYSVLKELGYSPDLIRPFQYRKQVHQYPGCVFSWKYRLKSELMHLLALESDESVRQRKVMRFLQKEFTFADLVTTSEDADRLADSYDYFLTGSDQIWNPYTLDTFYMLDFVADGNKKVAYSSSLAVNDIPEEMKPVYYKYLHDFKFLSCREQTGCDVLERVLRRDVLNVLDPVLLLSGSRWRQFSANASLKSIDVSDPYLFCYFIGDNPKHWQAVERMLARSGMRRCLVFTVSPSKYRMKGAQYLRTADISDFVWFLDHAKMVCTDSFHSMAMCVKLQKQFIAFIRCAENEKAENSRVYDFLKKYHLDSQIFQEDTCEHSLQPIAFDGLSGLLEADINRCKGYLVNNLS